MAGTSSSARRPSPSRAAGSPSRSSTDAWLRWSGSPTRHMHEDVPPHRITDEQLFWRGLLLFLSADLNRLVHARHQEPPLLLIVDKLDELDAERQRLAAFIGQLSLGLRLDRDLSLSAHRTLNRVHLHRHARGVVS